MDVEQIDSLIDQVVRLIAKGEGSEQMKVALIDTLTMVQDVVGRQTKGE